MDNLNSKAHLFGINTNTNTSANTATDQFNPTVNTNFTSSNATNDILLEKSFMNGTSINNYSILPQPQQPQQLFNPISRTSSSLMDSIGIQRSSSPFNQINNQFATNNPGNTNPLSRIQSIFSENSSNNTPLQNTNVPLYSNTNENNLLNNIISSNWNYIDNQNNLQGPFSTQLMSQWVQANYFQPDLKIIRVDNTIVNNTTSNNHLLNITNKIITLNDLFNITNNFIDPFTTFDIMLNNSNSFNNNTNNNISMNTDTNNNINTINNNSLVAESSILANNNKDNEINTDSINKKLNKFDIEPIADINSPDYTFSELINLPLTPLDLTKIDLLNFDIDSLTLSDFNFYHEISVPVPLQRQHKIKLNPNDNIDTTNNDSINDVWNFKETNVKNHSMELDKMKKLINKAKKDVIKQQNESLRLEKANSVAKELLIMEENEKSKQLEKIKKRNELKRQKKLKKEQEKLLREKEKIEQLKQQEAIEKLKNLKFDNELETETESQDEPNQSATSTNNGTSNKSIKTDSSNKTDDKKSIKSKPAPWVNKPKDKPIPLNSFLELQKDEEIKLQKLKQDKQLNAIKLTNQIIMEENEKTDHKKILNWANKPPVSKPINVINIKEELEKSKLEDLKKKSKTSTPIPDLVADNNSNNNTTIDSPISDPSFIKEQQKIWEELKKVNKSSTSTQDTNSNNNNNDSAWTTVSSKKTNTSSNIGNNVVKPKIKPVVSTKKQIGSSNSIPSLKNKFTSGMGTISSTQSNNKVGPVTYPGNSSISARQDFLRWCKSQLKLNANISKIDVLEVLLSLPVGHETNEIIADTIYSNSSVMDGKRFALEFSKRRIECEKQVKDPLSWSEALALPEVNDDDWEFQVVSKKKGRKY